MDLSSYDGNVAATPAAVIELETIERPLNVVFFVTPNLLLEG